MEIAEVTGRWERLRARLQPMLEDSDDPALLHRLFDSAARPVRPGSLLRMLATLPVSAALTRLRLARARLHFRDQQEYASSKKVTCSCPASACRSPSTSR